MVNLSSVVEWGFQGFQWPPEVEEVSWVGKLFEWPQIARQKTQGPNGLMPYEKAELQKHGQDGMFAGYYLTELVTWKGAR